MSDAPKNLELEGLQKNESAYLQAVERGGPAVAEDRKKLAEVQGRIAEINAAKPS